jgi:lipopolysaccharide transport system ATP-binding protein
LRGESTLEADRRRFTALKGISLDVKAGEVVGIIGPNGAGKSTLLKILSRITQPTRGRFMLYGRVGSLLEVGTGFHNDLTGRENVYLNGMILGMRREEIDRKFDEIVAFAGVEQFIDTPVKRYSSGMGVRLAFAVAAHLEPEILLIDEVLAVGDLSFQRKSIGKMQDVAGQGRTVLFVSHNMQAISRLCTRTVLLDHGQVIFDGNTDEAIDRFTRLMFENRVGVNIWALEDAPGRDGVRLRSVELLDEADQPVINVRVNQNLDLRIGYYIDRPNLSLRCSVTFWAHGVCAFVSVAPKETLHQETGLYYARVHIPPHLLAETDYSINITILSSQGVKYRYVQEQDVLSFQVVDMMEGDSARGDYAERLAGVMRPKLDWTLDDKPTRQGRR